MSEFTSTGTEYVDEFFAHHGIKGQKWGIRRWQNPDGSLTEKGKKRYGTKKNFEKAMADKKARSEKRKAAVKAVAKETLKTAVKVAIPAGLSYFSYNLITNLMREAEKNGFIENLSKIGKGIAVKNEASIKDQISNMLTDDVISELQRKGSVTVFGHSEPMGQHLTFSDICKITKETELAHSDEDSTNFSNINRIDNFFAHSGILGMKWGLRRYQNPDGTLTEAGRKRYAKKGTSKLISDKEKYRAQKAKWAKDPAMLYKHKDEYTKAELDKAMDVFASQNKIRAQIEADKAAKQKAKEDLKKSKIEYKKLQLQDKLNQAKAEEDYKQMKLKTEQAKLQNKQNEEKAKKDNQFASKETQIQLWKKRSEKAKNIMEFAKAGKTILDDMGITSKEEGESLLGSIAVGLGIKDISAAQAKKEAKEKKEKVEGALDFMNKIAKTYSSINASNKIAGGQQYKIKFDSASDENFTLDDVLDYFKKYKFIS